MDLRETGWKKMDWIEIAHNRNTMTGCCEDGNKPLGFSKGGYVRH
jgi:hypothetical protein